MSNIDELHSETKVLPVQTDTDMLATQFLVRCHKSHRSDYQTTQNPVERFIKHTLRTTHGVEIQQYLDEGLIISKLSESSEGYPSQPGWNYFKPSKVSERVPLFLPGNKGIWQGLAETQSTFISYEDEVLESNGNQEPNRNEADPTKSRRWWRWA